MNATLGKDDAKRDVLARIAAAESEEARLFARKMRLRAEADHLWNGVRSDGGPVEPMAASG